MTSSIYPVPFVANSSTAINGDVLSTPITITADQLKPGGGGILRLYFSFTTGADTIVSIFNNTVLKGTLNADNTNIIVSDGFYRFDIDVEAGDIINLQSSVAISVVNLFRAHLVQFGA